MKQLLFAAIMIASLSGYCQRAILFYPDGHSKGLIIKSITKDAIKDSEGISYVLSTIDSLVVDYPKLDPLSFENLKNSGVSYTPMYKVKDYTLDDVRIALSNFNRTRKAGKILQIVGLGVTTVGVFIAAPLVAGVGSTVSLIGFVTDIAASSHLDGIY